MQKAKHYVVLVSNDLFTDQRVHKVCSFLLDKGHQPTLVGRLLERSGSVNDRPYATRRFKLWFNSGPLFYANLNLRLFFYLLFKPCDGILANDLDTLLAAFCASKLKRKCKLIYDTHEFYTGVPELQARPSVRRVWEEIEGLIFPRLEHIYTVNFAIASKYEEIYGKKLLVVRNMSPKQNNLNPISRSELGIPADAFVGIMQGAGINVDRGAEEAVEAFARIPNAILLIVGDGDVVPQLKEKVQNMGWEKSVHFFPRMPFNEMMRYTAMADLGLSLDKTDNLNYQLSLPNKVFDYLQAETPLLASPVKQIVELLSELEFGTLVEKVSVPEIQTKVEWIMQNPQKLEEWKHVCKVNKEKYSWEGEVEKIAPFFE